MHDWNVENPFRLTNQSPKCCEVNLVIRVREWNFSSSNVGTLLDWNGKTHFAGAKETSSSSSEHQIAIFYAHELIAVDAILPLPLARWNFTDFLLCSHFSVWGEKSRQIGFLSEIVLIILFPFLTRGLVEKRSEKIYTIHLSAFSNLISFMHLVEVKSATEKWRGETEKWRSGEVGKCINLSALLLVKRKIHKFRDVRQEPSCGLSFRPPPSSTISVRLTQLPPNYLSMAL